MYAFYYFSLDLFVYLFFVLFFVISVAAFAEFANEAANYWSVGSAVSCFVAISMIIMLVPPAPGQIIDEMAIIG